MEVPHETLFIVLIGALVMEVPHETLLIVLIGALVMEVPHETLLIVFERWILRPTCNLQLPGSLS